jgi:DNA-binding SARP family transcriptional activator
MTTKVGEIGFNPRSAYWFDVARLEAEASQARTQTFRECSAESARALEAAAQLYTGDLLEGFYDDWALRERERLRGLYLNSLTYLMRYHRLHRTYDEALLWGQRILDHDPLREEIHREMMRMFLESGQRTCAVQQYEHCRALLETELGIAPMEETQALYAEIVPRGGPRRPLPVAIAREPATLREAVQQLQAAMRVFDEAREQLRCAMRFVEQHPSTEEPRRRVTGTAKR